MNENKYEYFIKDAAEQMTDSADTDTLKRYYYDSMYDWLKSLSVEAMIEYCEQELHMEISDYKDK